jgi:hypothetical protein
MKKQLILAVLLFCSGCGYGIGPFVRNIYIDREHNLVVERCDVRGDYAMGTVSIGDCKSEKYPLK